MKKNLLTFLCAICISAVAFATKTITVAEDADIPSYALPIYTKNAITQASVVQQVYLQSEIGETSKQISKLTFYVKNKSTTNSLSQCTRSVQVWLDEVDLDSMVITKSGTYEAKFAYNYAACTNQPGKKVYEGSITTPSLSASGTGSYDITFASSFLWSGSKKALLLTIFDVSKSNVTDNIAQNLRHLIKLTDEPRFILSDVTSANIDGYVSSLNEKYGDFYSTPQTVVGQCNTHKYIAKTTFTYEDGIPSPTSPSATDITGSSALVSWTAAAGAESYEVRWSTSICGLEEATPVNVGNVTSYTISGQEASTKYYYQIRTKIDSDYSAWTSEANFTTTAHIHDGITFTKWTYTTILPTSAGNYYLANDVTLSANWEPAGDLNLCLNGHTVNMGTYYGEINGETVAIYDCVGTGSITSSNSTQTLLASGSTSDLTIYADIENTGGGRKAIAASNALVTFANPIVFADNVNNSASFAEYQGVIITPIISRSFTSASYNTICLPFALTNSQLQSIFGSTYDLEEFVSSALDGEELVLTFNKVTSLTAGKPYLIQPAANVANPSFAGVTISTTSPVDQTSDTYISFHGVFNPTELEGGNKNLLFLGAANELFYPAATDNLNGFRAYFEVKGTAQKVAKRARIANGTNTATGISDVQRDEVQCTKILRDGQIVIIRQGAEYNAQGIRIK